MSQKSTLDQNINFKCSIKLLNLKKMKLFLRLLFFISLTISIDSCHKETVKGCMDKDSITYNPNATLDDGSCLYEGTVVIWYDKTTAQALSAAHVTALILYLDGLYIPVNQEIVGYTEAPSCNDVGSITLGEDLVHAKSRTSTLVVNDQDNNEYWNELVHFTANTCTKVQLIWDNRVTK
jgi:hypothetical protein